MFCILNYFQRLNKKLHDLQTLTSILFLSQFVMDVKAALGRILNQRRKMLIQNCTVCPSQRKKFKLYNEKMLNKSVCF